MKNATPGTNAARRAGPSRRALLRGIAATAALASFPVKRPPACGDERRRDGPADPKPLDAAKCVLDALRKFPLVALAERHRLQESHDFLTALLFHPELPENLTDIVVEFGNARHQDIADRFVVKGQPVADADLQQIWRHTVGGRVFWDAPVYAQFFRTVRAINWMRPPRRRLRVLLADPPGDRAKVRGAADKDYVLGLVKQRDEHYAGVVEREVLAKGRRALLVAGSGHLLRGVSDNFKQPNAATRLEKLRPGKLFVVDCLVVPPGTHRDGLLHRVQAGTADWPRPACALLADNWLGALKESAPPWINAFADRVMNADGARYGAQADAALYLGPGEVLTASRPDPTLYRSGPYAVELKRLSQVLSQIGPAEDLVAEGLRQSEAGPGWFAGS
jgi:hypothetical protein